MGVLGLKKVVGIESENGGGKIVIDKFLLGLNGPSNG